MLSTRERAALRNGLIPIGVTHLSAGSHTEPGGYTGAGRDKLHLTRRGRHLIRICDGTACHVRGAAKTIQAIENAFNLQPGGTSPDYKYTLEIVYCVGSCGLAPVAEVNDKVYGQTKPEPVVRQLKRLE